MITVTNPQKVNTVSSAYVRWQSNRQPYLFKFQRKDAQYYSGVSSGGFLQLRCLAAAITGITPEVGDLINVIDNSNGAELSGSITSIVMAGAPDWYFITDIPYQVVTTGWINFQKRENYKATVTLSAFVPSLNKTVLLGSASGTPNTRGEISIDVATFLTYGMHKENLFGFAVRNAIQDSGWLRFTMTYQDSFYIAGAVATTSGVVSNPLTFYAIDGVKQLQSAYGQNFADYEPQVGYVADAKFLTEFAKPVNFLGYPFALSFLFPSGLVDAVATVREEEFVNGAVVTVQIDNINTSLPASLQQLTMSPSFTSLTQEVDVWIQSGGVAGAYYALIDYWDAFYTTDIAAVMGTVLRLTEKKRVTIVRPCNTNPVYLMWKNSLGGWDFWLFDNVTEHETSAAQGLIYEPYIEDIETANKRAVITEAKQLSRVTCFASVTQEQFEGLKTIERSPQVYVLRDASKLTTEPRKAWQGVRIVPKGFKKVSAAQNIEVELTYELPELYSVGN